jgi:hypothetical protein
MGRGSRGEGREKSITNYKLRLNLLILKSYNLENPDSDSFLVLGFGHWALEKKKSV